MVYPDPEGINGLNILVSDAPMSDLVGQVADAERFLSENRPEIERLGNRPGVSDLILDFPIALRIDGENVVAQYNRFPASLVHLAGALGIGLELSIYPSSEE